MMRKLLCLLAVVALTAATADAADRWGRTSYGSRYNSGYSRDSRGGFNSFGASSSYGQRTYLFPQENTLVIQQDLGYGTSLFHSEPITQYGSSQINYKFDRNGVVDPYASGLIVRRSFWP